MEQRDYKAMYERALERMAERQMDRLDARYMDGRMTKPEYDIAVAEIDAYVKRELGRL